MNKQEREECLEPPKGKKDTIKRKFNSGPTKKRLMVCLTIWRNIQKISANVKHGETSLMDS